MAVIPVPDAPPGACLRDRVAAALGGRVWVVHRLDRDTSGVVVFARTAEAHRALSMAFERRDVVKHYAALVHGVPAPGSGTIDMPLHDARKGKARPARADEPGERPATTDYALTRAWTHDTQRIAAVAATPRTGRHHQIRAQLAAIKCPIKGDVKYGARRSNPDRSIHLHAWRLAFDNPATGERILLEAAPPDEVLWKALGPGRADWSMFRKTGG